MPSSVTPKRVSSLKDSAERPLDARAFGDHHLSKRQIARRIGAAILGLAVIGQPPSAPTKPSIMPGAASITRMSPLRI